LGLPDYILSPEQARRMEDLLPLKLFSQHTLQLILARDDPGLFFSMLPSTLLMESLHSKYLTRTQRIDSFLIGASLIILYELYKKVLKTPPEELLHLSLPSIPATTMCFTTEWSSEYVSVALHITALLYSETTLNLGACGTHLLEHYFGSIRRHSLGDNTHARFMKAMKNVFLEQYLLNELKIPRESPLRRSDSGYHVCDPLIEEKFNLMHYLQIARGLIQTVMHLPEGTGIFTFALPERPLSINEFSARYLVFEEKNDTFRSTKKTGQTATGGIRNSRIWSAINQMKDTTEDEDESE
jgi:hypothetical protein